LTEKIGTPIKGAHRLKNRYLALMYPLVRSEHRSDPIVIDEKWKVHWLQHFCAFC